MAHGKENGNYYITTGYIQGLYTENGKEHGNHCLGFRAYKTDLKSSLRQVEEEGFLIPGKHLKHNVSGSDPKP